jgi:hypothetical protein
MYAASTKNVLILGGSVAPGLLLLGGSLVRIKEFPMTRQPRIMYPVARTVLAKPIFGIK